MANEYFKGKKIWVTGASSGIGEALSLNLASQGAHLIISSIDTEGLERVRVECSKYSEKVISVPFDLSKTDDIPLIVEGVMQQIGTLDFLFNIGGISQRSRVEETPLWIDRKIFEINFFGTVSLIKAVLPYMISNRSGYILATSSINGCFGFPLRSAYSASKHAIHGFIETLYLENKINNIRASVIIPGRVCTNISYHALKKDGGEYGKLDAGQANGITPQKAAEQILRGVKRNKREILVGGKELLMLYIRKWIPSLFFRIADKIDN